jgi:recombination protein RecR
VKFPKPLTKLIESLERLPGIGPKTAQRLAFYLLHFPQENLENFANALVGLKTGTKLCSNCKNVAESEVCSVCDDDTRNKREILVVTSPLDAFVIEKTGYKGVYHVLHGVIDPLNNIGPEELFIGELLNRVEEFSAEVSFEVIDGSHNLEIILATSSSMEGESTALYISKMLRNAGFGKDVVKITRIARGLPVGGDIEYADPTTLEKALEGRSDYS